MDQVRIDFLVTGNMSSLLAQVEGLNAGLMQSAGTVNLLDRAFQKMDVGSIQRQFASALMASNQFDSQMVTLRSHTEGYGTALDRANVSGRKLWSETKQYMRGAGGEIRALAREQIRLQNSVVSPLGRTPTGAMNVGVHTPTGLAGDTTTQLRVANKEWEIFNRNAQLGATQMVNVGKNVQWAGRQLMVGFTVPLALAGGMAAKTFYDLDQSLIQLQKVYGSGLTFGDDFTKQSEQVREEAKKMAMELAQTYGQAGTETVDLMAQLAAAGYDNIGGDNLDEMTRQVTRLSTLGDMATDSAAKASIALQTAFDLPVSQLKGSIDFMNAVENQTSLSLDDIVQAIPRAGTVIKGLGGDVQDLTLLLSAMKEGGISAAEGANALKSGLSSIIAPPQAAVDFLKELGINLPKIVTDNEGDLVGTIMALQEAMKGLSDLQQQQAITKLFGKYQFARMGALFDNLGKKGSQNVEVLKLMGTSMQDLAQIADQELATKLNSASQTFSKMWETFKLSTAGVGEQVLKAGTKILDFLGGIMNWFNKHDLARTIAGWGLAFLAIIGPVVMVAGLFTNMLGTILKAGMRVINMFKVMGSKGGVAKQFEVLTVEGVAANQQLELMSSSLYKQAEAESILAEATNIMEQQYKTLGVAATGARMDIEALTRAQMGQVASPAGAAALGDRRDIPVQSGVLPLLGTPGGVQRSHFLPKVPLASDYGLIAQSLGMSPTQFEAMLKSGKIPNFGPGMQMFPGGSQSNQFAGNALPIFSGTTSSRNPAAPLIDPSGYAKSIASTKVMMDTPALKAQASALNKAIIAGDEALIAKHTATFKAMWAAQGAAQAAELEAQIAPIIKRNMELFKAGVIEAEQAFLNTHIQTNKALFGRETTFGGVGSSGIGKGAGFEADRIYAPSTVLDEKTAVYARDIDAMLSTTVTELDMMNNRISQFTSALAPIADKPINPTSITRIDAAMKKAAAELGAVEFRDMQVGESRFIAALNASGEAIKESSFFIAKNGVASSLANADASKITSARLTELNGALAGAEGAARAETRASVVLTETKIAEAAADVVEGEASLKAAAADNVEADASLRAGAAGGTGVMSKMGGAKGMGLMMGATMIPQLIPTGDSALANTAMNAISGAGMGAMVGSMIPVIGTGIGAAIGGALPLITGILGHIKEENERTAQAAAAAWEGSFSAIHIDESLADLLGVKSLDQPIQIDVVVNDATKSGNEFGADYVDYATQVGEAMSEQIAQMKAITDEYAVMLRAQATYDQAVMAGGKPSDAMQLVSEMLRQSGHGEMVIKFQASLDGVTTEKGAEKHLKDTIQKELDLAAKDVSVKISGIEAQNKLGHSASQISLGSLYIQNNLKDELMAAGTDAGFAAGSQLVNAIDSGVIHNAKDLKDASRQAVNSMIKGITDGIELQLSPEVSSLLDNFQIDQTSNQSILKGYLNLNAADKANFQKQIQDLLTTGWGGLTNEQRQARADLIGGWVDAFGVADAGADKFSSTISSHLSPNILDAANKAESAKGSFLSMWDAIMGSSDSTSGVTAKLNAVAASLGLIVDVSKEVNPDKLTKELTKQADQMDKAAAAYDPLIQKQQDLTDSLDNQISKLDNQISKINEQAQKEVDAINKKLDKKNEEIQREEDIFARRQEMRNMEISYQEAIANGNLFEAARIRMDMAATKKQRQEEDKANAAQSKADKQIAAIEGRAKAEARALEQKKRALEQEKKIHEKRMEMLQKEQDAANEAAQNFRDSIDHQVHVQVEANKELIADQEKHNAQVTKLLKALAAGNVEQARNLKEKLGMENKDFQNLLLTSWSEFPDNLLGILKKALAKGDWSVLGKLATAAFGGASPRELRFLATMAQNNGTGVSPGADATRRASGGFISGPGSATSDQIPALLSNGEYVMRQGAVAKYGKTFFDSLNNGPKNSYKGTGGTAAYATGGMVGPVMQGIMAPVMKALLAMVPGAGVTATTGEPGKYGNTMLNAEQLANAATIISVGSQMGATRRDLLSGIMTALQESHLINVNYGADDSLGLFQQRPSMGWGTPEQVMDPAYASRQYFKHLMAIPNRDRMRLGEMSQAVQRSAFPSYYTQWADEARAILKATSMGSASSPERQQMVNFVKAQLGEPYVFGAAGPNQWDCSGLTMAAAALAGHSLPHAASSQYSLSRKLPKNLASAGDLAFFNPGTSGAPAGLPGHVGMMVGDKAFVHAANPSVGVIMSNLDTTTNDFVGIGSIPGLRKGGRINYDNTIANLHRGETVLTAPLSNKFEDNVANSGNNTYNFDVAIESINSDVDLERAFEKFVVKHERRQEQRGGRSRRV